MYCTWIVDPTGAIAVVVVLNWDSESSGEWDLEEYTLCLKKPINFETL